MPLDHQVGTAQEHRGGVEPARAPSHAPHLHGADEQGDCELAGFDRQHHQALQIAGVPEARCSQSTASHGFHRRPTLEGKELTNR